METKQKELLLRLAKKLEKSPVSKEAVIKSLNSAKIVTKTGDVSKHYPNLERIITAAK